MKGIDRSHVMTTKIITLCGANDYADAATRFTRNSVVVLSISFDSTTLTPDEVEDVKRLRFHTIWLSDSVLVLCREDRHALCPMTQREIVFAVSLFKDVQFTDATLDRNKIIRDAFLATANDAALKRTIDLYKAKLSSWKFSNSAAKFLREWDKKEKQENRGYVIQQVDIKNSYFSGYNELGDVNFTDNLDDAIAFVRAWDAEQFARQLIGIRCEVVER